MATICVHFPPVFIMRCTAKWYEPCDTWCFIFFTARRHFQWIFTHLGWVHIQRHFDRSSQCRQKLRFFSPFCQFEYEQKRNIFDERYFFLSLADVRLGGFGYLRSTASGIGISIATIVSSAIITIHKRHSQVTHTLAPQQKVTFIQLSCNLMFEKCHHIERTSVRQSSNVLTTVSIPTKWEESPLIARISFFPRYDVRLGPPASLSQHIDMCFADDNYGARALKFDADAFPLPSLPHTASVDVFPQRRILDVIKSNHSISFTLSSI